MDDKNINNEVINNTPVPTPQNPVVDNKNINNEVINNTPTPTPQTPVVDNKNNRRIVIYSAIFLAVLIIGLFIFEFTRGFLYMNSMKKFEKSVTYSNYKQNMDIYITIHNSQLIKYQTCGLTNIEDINYLKQIPQLGNYYYDSAYDQSLQFISRAKDSASAVDSKIPKQYHKIIISGLVPGLSATINKRATLLNFNSDFNYLWNISNYRIYCSRDAYGVARQLHLLDSSNSISNELRYYTSYNAHPDFSYLDSVSKNLRQYNPPSDLDKYRNQFITTVNNIKNTLNQIVAQKGSNADTPENHAKLDALKNELNAEFKDMSDYVQSRYQINTNTLITEYLALKPNL